MGVKNHWLPIRFLRGINTEGDEKALAPGTPTKVENGIFRTGDTIDKRFGTRRLSRTVAGTTYTYLTGAMGLASRDDGSDLVILSSDDRILSYQGSEWVDRGDWIHLKQDSLPLPRGAHEAWDPTTASSGSVRIVAWEDSRGGVFAQMLSTDGVAYQQPFRVGGSEGRSPRALAVRNRFHVYFLSGSTLNVGVLDAANPTSTSASYVELHPSVDTVNPMYDVVTHSNWNTARLAVSISGSTRLMVIRSNGAIGISGSSPSWPDPVSLASSDCGPAIAVSADGLTLAIARQSISNLGLYIDSVDANSLQTHDSYAIDDSTALTTLGGTRRIAVALGEQASSTNGDYDLYAFAEVSASDALNRNVRYIHQRTVNETPTTTVIRHSSLGSRPFRMDDRTYVWLTRPSSRLPADYLLRDDGLFCGHSRPGRCVLDVSGTLANVDVRDNTAYRAATTRDLLTLPEASGSGFSGRHLRLVTTEFRPANSWRPIDVDGVLMFGGGWLGMYDGAQVTEHGFAHPVEAATITPGSGSGGNLLSASYAWVIIPEAFDARGNRHLGDGYIATGSISSTENSASLTWSTMVHTMRDGVRAPDIRYAVYRTGPNGTTFQRIDDPSRPVVNSTGSDTVTFVDNVSEARRALGELLYSDTEDAHTSPLAPSQLTQAGDRVYLAGLEGQPYDVMVSELRLGGAVAFDDDGIMSIDSGGGPITALGSLDDRVVAFKRSRIFAAAADGPGNSSTDTTPWPLFQQVTSDVGAPAPGTVFQVAGTTVQGLVFESARGVRLLDRGVVARDIGGGVRAYDGLTVVGGVSSETDETCRLYTSEGTTLVYNARFDQWSTFPGQDAVAATLWNGRPAYLAADGYVYVEEPGSYRDGVNPVRMTIELGWIGPAGMQGTGRLRELSIIGTYYSPHRLRVEMGYDYRDHWLRVRETHTSSSLRVYPYGGVEGNTAPSASDGTPAYSVMPSAYSGFIYDSVLEARSTGTVGNSYLFSLRVGSHGDIEVDEFSGFTRTTVYFTEGVTTAGFVDALIDASSSLLQVRTASSDAAATLLESEEIEDVPFVSGTDAVTGSDYSYGYSPYGGQDPVYQFRIASPIQRCQAFRLRFSDHDQEGSGRSLSLSEVKVLMTPESGRPRVPRRKLP